MAETPMCKSGTLESTMVHRRNFFGGAAAALAAAQLNGAVPAKAQEGTAAPRRVLAGNPGMKTSFGPLKQIEAGVLSVGYAETGPADGPPVLLLHGWPYDIHTYVDVAPLL